MVCHPLLLVWLSAVCHQLPIASSLLIGQCCFCAWVACAGLLVLLARTLASLHTFTVFQLCPLTTGTTTFFSRCWIVVPDHHRSSLTWSIWAIPAPRDPHLTFDSYGPCTLPTSGCGQRDAAQLSGGECNKPQYFMGPAPRDPLPRLHESLSLAHSPRAGVS